MKISYKIILINILVILGLIGSIATYNVPRIDQAISSLEEGDAKNILNKVYEIVSLDVKNMNEYKNNILELRKKNLKNVADIVWHILQFYYNSYKKGVLSEEEAKKRAFKEIGEIRYGKNGYIFIFDNNYYIVAHANKDWIGTFMYNKMDSKGNYYAREMIEKTRKNKESFTRYWWAKIRGKEYEKISYTKLFEPWKLYIGTGVYIDDINKIILKKRKKLLAKLTSLMKKNKIAKNGYIFIFDKDGNMIIHPDSSLIGSDFKSIKDPVTSKLLYKELIKACNSTGYLKYKWNKIDDLYNYNYDKISWIKYEPLSKWYIASSAYLDDIHKTSKTLFQDIIRYGSIFLVVSFLLTILIVKRILSPFKILTNAVRDVKAGKYDTRINIKTKDEFGILADGFNSMTRTVQNNIQNLDKKIQEKTQELVVANKKLQQAVKEAIEETRKKEKLLQRQSSLAQMGEMISMIAHQWRQPLGAIGSTIVNIQTKLAIGKFDLNTKEGVDEFLRFLNEKHTNINEYVQNLSETIDDFRNFFKPDKHKEKTTLSEPIFKALNIVKTSMNNKGIDIECNILADAQIILYKNEVMQVILNILKNSEDNFIERKISHPKITITTKESKNEYIIDICDNGGGIAKSILPSIFDPYFSTKDEKNGTGLGLYMSKIMIEEHNNGILTVKNNKEGVCFTIKFKKETANKDIPQLKKENADSNVYYIVE